MPTVYSRIDSNEKETFLFVSVFFAFLMAAAYIVDILLLKNHYVSGAVLGGIFLAGLANYAYSDKIILKKNKAFALRREEHEELYRSVENLCLTAGLKAPRIFATDDPAINAFTVGRGQNNATVVFTRGALEKLEPAELEGVIAHELSHIENKDIMLGTMLAILLGFVRAIVDIVKHLSDAFAFFLSAGDSTESMIKVFFIGFFYSLLIFILSLLLVLSFIPVIEELIFYKISRGREFLADADAALLTRYPKGLIGALEKTMSDGAILQTVNSSTAHLYIVSPFRDNLHSFWRRLFHGHPPIEERIEILREMDGYGEGERAAQV